MTQPSHRSLITQRGLDIHRYICNGVVSRETRMRPRGPGRRVTSGSAALVPPNSNSANDYATRYRFFDGSGTGSGYCRFLNQKPLEILELRA
jgi:hypothetical protein